MEVFGSILDFLRDSYIYYVIGIQGFYEFILPKNYVPFFTALTVVWIPIALLSRRAIGGDLIEVSLHVGLWIYSIIIAWIWLHLSDNADIGFGQELRGHVNSSLFAFIGGIWGVLSLRGEQYTIQRGIERVDEDCYYGEEADFDDKPKRKKDFLKIK